MIKSEELKARERSAGRLRAIGRMRIWSARTHRRGTHLAVAGIETGSCRPATHQGRVTCSSLGLVRSRRRAPGGWNEGPLQGDRSQPTALYHEPALHLVGPARESCLFLGDRPAVGGRRQARAACDRLVRPPLDLRLHHPARAHGGMAQIYTSAWLLVSLGVAVSLVPSIRAAWIGVTKLASVELSRSCWVWSSRSPGSSLSGIGSNWRESQAVPCRRPIRPTSS